MKILVAVDGSAHSLRALKYTVEQARLYRYTPTLELVYVQPPLPYLSRVKAVTGDKEIQRYYDEQGRIALEDCRRFLHTAGITYLASVLIGSIADKIVERASETSCAFIVVATRGMGAAGNLFMGSIATKVLHISKLPVLVVK